MTITRVTRVGWIARNEGLGRPFEGWWKSQNGSWRAAGRAFTYSGALRKAHRRARAVNLSDGQ